MTQDEIKTMLDYDPSSGQFRWRVSRGRSKAGSAAGSINHEGYVVIAGRYAHRLAFIYMTGRCPAIVDHIDRDKSHNAWANLRGASKALNAINSKASAANKSGLRGVSWHAAGRKWQAHCGTQYLGLFDTKEAAHVAYRNAAESYS